MTWRARTRRVGFGGMACALLVVASGAAHATTRADAQPAASADPSAALLTSDELAASFDGLTHNLGLDLGHLDDSKHGKPGTPCTRYIGELAPNPDWLDPEIATGLPFATETFTDDGCYYAMRETIIVVPTTTDATGLLPGFKPPPLPGVHSGYVKQFSVTSLPRLTKQRPRDGVIVKVGDDNRASEIRVAFANSSEIAYQGVAIIRSHNVLVVAESLGRGGAPGYLDLTNFASSAFEKAQGVILGCAHNKNTDYCKAHPGA